MTDSHPLDRLFAVIQSRKNADAANSYTAKLFAKGRLAIAKKLGEEAVEVALAGVAEDEARLAEESADLLYHLLVLWAERGLSPAMVYAALDARSARSGLEEKAARRS